MKHLIPFKFIKESMHFDLNSFNKHDNEIILNVKDMLTDLEDIKILFMIRFFQNQNTYPGLTINISSDSKFDLSDISSVVDRIDTYLIDNGYTRDLSFDSFKILNSGNSYRYKAYYRTVLRSKK